MAKLTSDTAYILHLSSDEITALKAALEFLQNKNFPDPSDIDLHDMDADLDHNSLFVVFEAIDEFI